MRLENAARLEKMHGVTSLRVIWREVSSRLIGTMATRVRHKVINGIEVTSITRTHRTTQ
jgi:hypothetical protein